MKSTIKETRTEWNSGRT